MRLSLRDSKVKGGDRIARRARARIFSRRGAAEPAPRCAVHSLEAQYTRAAGQGKRPASPNVEPRDNSASPDGSRPCELPDLSSVPCAPPARDKTPATV